ncbi:MAG: sugar ABC transporter permease [Armatimonadetes bacterium]|nr:sugar ABC transporter permease [Armatimonadota bacterium]
MNRRALFVASYLAPAAVLYGLFVLVPFVQTFQLSFFSFRGVSSERRWVGPQYYQALATDEVVPKVLAHLGFLLIGGGLCALVMAMVTAHALQENTRLARFVRGVFLFPQVVSVVAVAVMWQFLYAPNGGLINGFLRAVGLGGMAKSWLGDTTWALPAVGVAWVWFAVGFYIMLFAAGIKGIPAEIGEAASLEGCFGWKRFVSITWPMLWSVRRVAVVYVAVNVFNVFALVNVMTNGGPARATETFLTYIYEQGFSASKFGYASALAIVNLAVILVVTFALGAMFRKNPEGART